MLKRKSDGSFHSIKSKSDAALARDRVDAITQEVYKLAKKVGIPVLLDEQAALKAALDGYVVEAESFESESWQGTRVQAHTRNWNVDKLRKKLTPALFKRIIKVSVDNAAIDGLVREGKIVFEDIEDALDEKPNKPYVKWTPRGKDIQDAGVAEAEKLAAMLS
jgi:16S rRNA C967 or C1407 C5-methylase (RsmB/RsmF family)